MSNTSSYVIPNYKKGENEVTIVCCDCSGSSIYIDYKLGEIVCKNCGLVQPNAVVWKDEVYES